MKTFFKILFSASVALMIMAMSSFIIHTFKLNNDSFLFLAGWISCMGYYISMESFEKWTSNN